ncbi:MAG: glycerophosphoryl diester phosphodiesterase [Nitrospirota bacterium]|nr:glycerophosphoryl diester phosphodiesterase [Nitrospirota bacterium]
MGKVLRIGHRGAAGHAPENTLASVEKAISLGADLVEVDVQRTSDGHLVIIHDKRVDRTTNGAGLVAGMSLCALRELDAGAGQRIPTVEELLRIAEGQVGLILELKVNGLAEQVCKTVRLSGFTGQVIYASFIHDEVRSIREADPRTMTMALFGRLPHDPVMVAQNAKATHIGFSYITVTKPLVETCHHRGLVVFVYTVNDRQDIKEVMSLGVDGIVSDFPDRL